MASFLRAPCEAVPVPTNSSRIAKYCEKWVLVATILGSSMAFIDGTIVNVALPALQDALHTSISQMQWVIEAYALTLASLLLVGGAWGDLYGRRKIFLIGILIFTSASVWCGLAATISQLIMARTIQGIGAALLVPGSLALISASFPEERRGQAIGTWAGFTSITSAAGPVVGGWLIQHASWRWVFFLNLPLAIIVFIVTFFYVSESKNEHQTQGLDLVGALLATLGLAAIVFGLIEWEYGNSWVIASVILGVITLTGFFFVEAHISSPMVPLVMFRSRNFSGANTITFFLYFALYGVLFFFPLDLIQVQDYTPTEAGAALLPFILLMFVLSRWSGGLVKRFGPRLPLIVGPAITALGFALFIRSGIGESYWRSFFPATVTLGLGMAVSVAPLTTVVMNSIAMDHAGAASGINNAVSRIAGLLAIAILGLVMTTIFNQQLLKGLQASALPVTTQQQIFNQRSQLAGIKTNDKNIRQLVQQSFVTGFEVIVLIGTILAIASSLSAALILEDKRLSKMTNAKRIVIVGGGAGGLELANLLGKKFGKRKKAEITLVDSSPIHLWKPLLHEVASGTLNSYDDELSYLAYASDHYFQFCLGTMQGLNRGKKEIILKPLFDEDQQEIIPERSIPYDILVIAVGSVSNDFNIPGVKEECLVIDNSQQALQFQQHLIKTMMSLPYQKQDQPFNIAIVGGGATGVELAAELHYALHQMAVYGFAFDPNKITINLIEAAPRLLPALSPHLSKSVQEKLKVLDIVIHTNEQVSKITPEGVLTKSGKFIPATLKTWAAGIKAPEFLKELDGLEVNKLNQLVVKPTLQTTVDDSIFAMGDCASCPQEGSDKPVPPRAQAAHQQADFLLKAITDYLNNQPLPHYQYRDYGSLISLSRYETIGNLMGRITKSLMIEGMLARFAYLSLYRAHQRALYGWWRVAMMMVANFLTKQIRPRLKLH